MLPRGGRPDRRSVREPRLWVGLAGTTEGPVFRPGQQGPPTAPPPVPNCTTAGRAVPSADSLGAGVVTHAHTPRSDHAIVHQTRQCSLATVDTQARIHTLLL